MVQLILKSHAQDRRRKAMTDHHPECEDVTGAYPGSCTCAAIRRKKAMDNLIAQDADLIDVPSGVTEADREVLIRISNSDDETAQRIRRGLIYTWEVGEIARHRQQATEAQAAEIERLRKEINRTHDKAYWAGVEDGKRAALEQSK